MNDLNHPCTTCANPCSDGGRYCYRNQTNFNELDYQEVPPRDYSNYAIIHKKPERGIFVITKKGVI